MTEFTPPDNAELVDDVFYVWKSRYGLYSTATKEGRQMMTGATKDGVTTVSYTHLTLPTILRV